MRRLPVLLAVLALVACGSTKHAVSSTPLAPNPASAIGHGATTLYGGGNWAVVLQGGKPIVMHLTGTVWHRASTAGVRIEILGPKPGQTAAKLPQIAAQVFSKRPLVETGLWVDGQEVLTKGGGSPTRATIYGAPDSVLRAGTHTAIAYGRSATSGHAIAWTFRVP